MGDTPNHAVEISLGGGGETRRRLFHPFTGEDLGDPLPVGFRATAWTLDLHDNLLGGRTGRRINGIGAFFFIVLALTGVVIWWPGIRSWRRSLIPDLRANWRRLNWSLHSAFGICVMPFVLMWGVSGAYLSFPDVFQVVVDYFEPFDPSDPVDRFGDRVLYWLAYLHFGRLGGPRCSWLRSRPLQRDDHGRLGRRRTRPTDAVRDRGRDVVEPGATSRTGMTRRGPVNSRRRGSSLALTNPPIRRRERQTRRFKSVAQLQRVARAARCPGVRASRCCRRCSRPWAHRACRATTGSCSPTGWPPDILRGARPLICPAPGQHDRKIVRCVLVGVGHAGPEDDHDAVEQCAVAILGRP